MQFGPADWPFLPNEFECIQTVWLFIRMSDWLFLRNTSDMSIPPSLPFMELKGSKDWCVWNISDIKGADFLRSGSCWSEFFEIHIFDWRSGAPTEFKELEFFFNVPFFKRILPIAKIQGVNFSPIYGLLDFREYNNNLWIHFSWYVFSQRII